MLAVVHLIWPAIAIDSITLGLLAIAVLPWFGSLFSSIELPGGWKFEFRELKKEITQQLEAEGKKVHEINSRIKRVEEFFISGAITPDLNARLQASLRQYHNYMHEVGFSLPERTPDIHIASKREVDPQIGDASNNAYYDGQKNRIVIGENIAKEIHVLLREYTHHILMGFLKKGLMDFEFRALESAFADYFPCSFLENPSYWGRSLDNQHSFTETFDPTDYWSRGLVWAGVLWELRDKFGKLPADQMMLNAWKQIAEQPAQATDRMFREVFMHVASGDAERDIIDNVFTARGLADGA